MPPKKEARPTYASMYGNVVANTVMRRMVEGNFLEEVRWEERQLKVRREAEGIGVNNYLSHGKPVSPVTAKPRWLQLQK